MTVPVAATQFAAAVAVRHAGIGLADAPKAAFSVSRRLTDRLAIAFRRPLKLAHIAALSMIHWRALEPLRTAPKAGVLASLLKAHPDCWALTLTPLVTSAWDARTRLTRLVDHCNIVESLGSPFHMKPFDYVDLLWLDGIGEQYRVTLDQPGWLLRDGLATLSLWDGADRMFTLSFCLAEEHGERIAYVGGIQGRRDEAALDKYRELTKAASGMRPRDLLIELFRLLCQSIAVDRILCVSNDIRYQQSRYFQIYGSEPHVDASYDQAWEERAATRRDDGFFELPLERVDRAADEIPARKRAMYRQRYAMLDKIKRDLFAAISSGLLQAKSHGAAFVSRAAA